MLKGLTSILLLSSASLVNAATVHRGGAELLNPKAYSVWADVNYFQTSAYYNVDGEEIEKVDGNDFSLMDVNLKLNYGFSENFQLGAMARIRSVSSTINEETIDNSGIESLGLEFKYGFKPQGNIKYAVGAYYRQTLYDNTTSDGSIALPTDEVILGDSGSEYGVNFYATYKQDNWKLDGSIGYRSPANDLSEEIVYKVEAIYQFSRLGVLAGVEGNTSLGNDPFTDDPTTKPTQNTGASRLFNSINREVMSPYLGAYYLMDSFLIGVKGQTVMSGVSTDKGNTLSAFLTWNSSGDTKEQKKINAFKEYSVEGSVLKVSTRGNFIRIDQGLATDVEKGMKFDIYQTDYFGGNVLVASGVVYEVGSDWSIIKLAKKYKDIEIKPGFAARGHME